MSRLYTALQRAGRIARPLATSNDELSSFAAEDHRDPAGGGEDPVDSTWNIDNGSVAAGTAVIDDGVASELTVPRPDRMAVERAATAAAAPVRSVPADRARDDSHEVAVADVLRLVISRWKVVTAAIAIGVAIAAGYNTVADRVYEARARVLVDIDQQVVPFRIASQDTGRDDYLVTQLEILKSPGLARKTLEKMTLLTGDERHQSTQIHNVVGALGINPIKSDMGQSRVINVTFRSTDPQYAAKMANGISEAYVEQNLDMRRQGSREASAWLNERLGDLRKEVTAREGALQQYREQKDAVSLDDKQNIVVQKLAQLNAAVTATKTDTAMYEARYKQLMAIQDSGEPVDTFPAIIANSLIQGLKADLASLLREKAQLAEHLGDLHPDMIKVNTAIDAAQHRLDAEMSKIIEGVKNDYLGAQAREKGLVTALEAQKREVLNLNQQSIAYGALQRDASTTQQIFESVLQRVKETDITAQLQSNNVRILDRAEVPRTPVLPRKELNLIVGLMGGLFIAVAFVLGLHHLNPRITTADDIKEALGLPILGLAPQVGALKDGPRIGDRLPPEFHEAMRNIRTRILLSPLAAASRSLAVTSTAPGEGKSTVASSLAASLAMAGRKVLLIDADMRRPQVHDVFDLARSPGLSNVLAGEVKAPEAVHESPVKDLYVLTAGDQVAAVSEPLDNESLAVLIRGFGEHFDFVVLDCPPVMAIADASIIANATASVVFVVGAGTSRDVAQSAVERLTSVQAQILGVVLNKAEVSRRSAYYYHYYHQSA